MKQGSLRRRSKLEITEAKRLEAARAAEVEKKLADFEKMQAQIQELRQQAAAVNQVQGLIENLTDAGLIKRIGETGYEGVDSYEEHQQLAAQRQAERE